MFHEHKSIKSPLRKCMKAVYYWLMVANYAFCYAVCGMPLVCCWALLSSTSSYLYTFILQPCLIIMQLWGSILMIPIRSIAGNLLQQPLRHIIRAICLRRKQQLKQQLLYNYIVDKRLIFAEKLSDIRIVNSLNVCCIILS